MFGLTQISKSPTRILFSSTSLFNQMLTSVPERINQAGVINEKLVYQTTNVLIGLGKIEFKMEVSKKKKKNPFTHELRDLYFQKRSE